MCFPAGVCDNICAVPTSIPEEVASHAYRPEPVGDFRKNRLLLTTLHRNFVGPFTAKEAAEALGLSAPECHRLLSYLSGRGWLTRIRRGLYGLVSLDTTHPDEWVGDPWVLAAKLYGPSYYIGGWSACEHWDLTEQLFRETVVVTSRRARRRDSLVHGIPLLVRFTSEDKIFGSSFVWRDQTRVNVSDPSRTVVDLLSDPPLGGGIRHVADVLETCYHVAIIGMRRSWETIWGGSATVLSINVWGTWSRHWAWMPRTCCGNASSA